MELPCPVLNKVLNKNWHTTLHLKKETSCTASPLPPPHTPFRSSLVYQHYNPATEKLLGVLLCDTFYSKWQRKSERLRIAPLKHTTSSFRSPGRKSDNVLCKESSSRKRIFDGRKQVCLKIKPRHGAT